MKHLAKYLKNRIWFIAAAVLLVLLAVQGCGKLYEPAMALEQVARCGETEHVHNEDCYMDELLICGMRAHTHSENCYIFRVDENDLNAILTDMGEKKIYSLEEYMAHTLSSVYGEGASLDDVLRYTSVEELNALLAASGDSKLRFNAAADLPATYALGDAPQTSGNFANYYILLDGKVTFVGYTSLSKYTDYSYSIDRSIALAEYTNAELIVKNAIDTSTLNSTYYLRYTSSIPQTAASFDKTVGVSGSNLTFGEYSSKFTTPPAYAILTTRTGGNWISGYTYAPVPFYTVTLDYGGDTNEVQYVQEGQNSTLKPNTDNYTWYASNDPNATPLKNNAPDEA